MPVWRGAASGALTGVKKNAVILLRWLFQSKVDSRRPSRSLPGGDAMKVFIELRDVNYPGSTYTLTYDPASDQLKGVYYQAAAFRRFPVAYVRMK